MAAIASSPARGRRRIDIGLLALYAVLIALGVVILIPIAYMISQAFTPEGDTMVWPIQYIPNRPTLNNFVGVLTAPPLPVLRWFLNSMFASLSITALVLLLS